MKRERWFAEPFDASLLPDSFKGPAPKYRKWPEPTRDPEPRDRIIREGLRKIDGTMVQDLTDRQRQAIAGRFLSGKTNAEIARDWGVSRQAVSDAQRRGLIKLGVLNPHVT